jgi:hypothetical protein
MRTGGVMVGLIVGAALGVAGTALCVGPIEHAVHLEHLRQAHQLQQLQAGTSDRFEDYIMCTGAVAVNPRAPTDGVWLLDYRAGKLLGTVVDRGVGKIVGFAELDLPKEFGIPPKQNVHFLMTTGTIAQGQAALYVAETTSGKFGVYTLGPDPVTGAGLVIRRHDLTTFRKAGKN